MPVALSVADDVEHVLHDGRRQAERRLVEHDELGLAHQAAADRQHLLLAAGQRAGRLRAPLGEPREQRRARDRGSWRGGAGARQHGAHLEILVTRQGRKHLPAFGDLADAEIADAVARPAGDVGAAKHDAAARRRLHAGDGADQRGLAGAIGADDGDDLALRDLERHAVERLRVAIEQVEVFDARASQRLRAEIGLHHGRDRAPRLPALPSAILAP